MALPALFLEGALALFSIGSVRVWQRNFAVWRKRYAASLTGNLGEPILFLFAMGYGLGSMVAPIEGVSYIEFIAPGLVGSATMYGATFEGTFGTYTRMAVQRTYDAIRVTPISLDEVSAGDILWAATKGMIAGIVFLLVMFLFGLIKSWWVLLLPLLMLVLSTGFAALAIIFSAKAPSYDFFSYYLTLIIAPMFLFCGIFFPLDNLPLVVRTLVWFTPLVHFVDVSRALVTGQVSLSCLVDVLWLLLFTPLAVTFAIRGVRKRVQT